MQRKENYWNDMRTSPEGSSMSSSSQAAEVQPASCEPPEESRLRIARAFSRSRVIDMRWANSEQAVEVSMPL